MQAEDPTGYWAFRLHEVEGRSYREIETNLAIGHETARRACERMKKQLDLKARQTIDFAERVEGSGRGALWYGNPAAVLRGRLLEPGIVKVFTIETVLRHLF
jgi:hypothetical protein